MPLDFKTCPIFEIRSQEAWKNVLQEIRGCSVCGLSLATTCPDPLASEIRLAFLALPTGEAYVANIFELGEKSLQDLAALVEDGCVKKILHDAKLDLEFIRITQQRRMKFKNIFDIMLASQICWSGYYSLAPSKSPKHPWKKKILDHSLDALAERHLGIILDKIHQIEQSNNGSPTIEQIDQSSRRAQVLLPLHSILSELLVKNGLERIAELEFRTLAPVVEMELSGIYLDADAARALILEREGELIEVFGELQSEAKRSGFAPAPREGRDPCCYLNPDSQEDIKNCLRHMGFCITSTKAEVLLELVANGCVFAERLLSYRRTSHQLAFLNDWLLQIHPHDGRIHPKYFQMHAATGRLSSRKPNAQQVPRKGDGSLALRRLFKAPSGKKLVRADFSAVEMRIMACLSGDETMIMAFQEGQDLHRLTASKICGLPPDRITKAQRDAAKVVNFLLIYGGSAETLQWRTLSDYGVVMSLEEAHEAVEKYFEVYSGVRAWQEKQIREMSYSHRHYFHNFVQGFFDLPLTCAFTILGRMRVWPRFGAGIRATKFQLFNTPCQGTGADLIKMVMCALYDRLSSEDARIIASIHDEIILEVPEDLAESYAKMLVEIMNRIGSELLYPVPVTSEAEILSTWAG